MCGRTPQLYYFVFPCLIVAAKLLRYGPESCLSERLQLWNTLDHISDNLAHGLMPAGFVCGFWERSWACVDACVRCACSWRIRVGALLSTLLPGRAHAVKALFDAVFVMTNGPLFLRNRSLVSGTDLLRHVEHGI